MKAARVEVARATSTFTMAAVEARKLAGDVVPMDASPAGAGKLAVTLRVPVGVVGAISPFNFPFNLVAHKVAPALAAGCAVVLKPASQTPLSALLLAELETEAGLPAGWLNVVCGAASEIGDVLVGDERVALITFTGSSVVGWKLRERAPRKRVNLELGNATPVIVAADADLDDVATRLAANAFSFAGQSCISVQRIYVERDAYDAFLERFLPKVDALVVGDPADDATDVGPLIAPTERDRVLEWIDEATARRWPCPHRRHARRRAPPADGRRRRSSGCQGACDEVFGPLCTVSAYDSLDEAIALANGTRYGLQAGRFHPRHQGRTARRAAARVRRGHDQRGADLPSRPDAVRRGQGFREHTGGPGIRGPRDDRGASRRAPALDWRTMSEQRATSSSASGDARYAYRFLVAGAETRAEGSAGGSRGASPRPRRSRARDVQARPLQCRTRRGALRRAHRNRGPRPGDRLAPRRHGRASAAAAAARSVSAAPRSCSTRVTALRAAAHSVVRAMRGTPLRTASDDDLPAVRRAARGRSGVLPRVRRHSRAGQGIEGPELGLGTQVAHRSRSRSRGRRGGDRGNRKQRRRPDDRHGDRRLRDHTSGDDRRRGHRAVGCHRVALG